MGRSIYRVIPDERRAGYWKLVHDGKVIDSHDRKTRAVAEGRRAARADIPSQVVVHTGDGRVQVEYTYRGDPHSPRG